MNDRDVLLYLEAISRIKEAALFLPKSTTREQIIQDTLKSYLAQKDLFSEYLTRQEYLDFKKYQSDRYVGIGMELEKTQEGAFLCFPYPGSPAESAGISKGDRIISINGTSVQGKALFTVATMARGEMGATVSFVLTTKDGVEKRISTTLSDTKIDSVSKSFVESMPVVKILYFSNNTRSTLARILGDLEGSRAIVLDLRGNSGGDLHAAIDSANLFVAKGKRLLSIKTPDKVESYESSGGEKNQATIYIWQDGRTASAAEVFIAALTQNNRGVSIGTRSFGKGTRQDIMELSDGSALVLTTGYLLTPDGTRFDGQGLNPSYALKNAPLETKHYMSKVHELNNKK